MEAHKALAFLRTRLHSSRMRTARAFTASPSMLCTRGVCLLLGGGIQACTEADPPLTE